MKDSQSIIVKEINPATLRGRSIDLFLVSSGYETRASFIAKELEELDSAYKIALAFQDRASEPARLSNDEKLQDLGFKLRLAGGSEEAQVLAVMEHATSTSETSRPGRPFRILIDYSCMTRVWYAAIIRYLWYNFSGDFEACFLYAPSEYVPPDSARPNRYVEALKGYSSLASPTKPTALVLGLGYESQRASGLVSYVEPASTVAFLADPVFEPQFIQAAEKANRAIIKDLSEQNIVRYPLNQLRTAGALLESCCMGLRKDHRVIIAPLGPKPFTLLSLMLACQYPGIEVWRVSAGEKGGVKSREALGPMLGIEVAAKGN